MNNLRNLLLISITAAFMSACGGSTAQNGEWELVWQDEFDNDGMPDPASWSFEEGFKRNNEAQWYQEDNAICKDGILTIEGRVERVKNPNYDPNSNSWRENREYAEYTASSINSRGKQEFLYGRFEVRAKIPAFNGSWPAIWTLGTAHRWPSCGEIDIMEYYLIDDVPHILANVAHGDDNNSAVWDSAKIPFSKFLAKDSDWASKFHIWRMDWDEEAIRLYLDDELLNETLLSETINGSAANFSNPFKTPQYILLNLALGGDHGGEIDNSNFPLKYEIDYVRVYQKKK